MPGSAGLQPIKEGGSVADYSQVVTLVTSTLLPAALQVSQQLLQILVQ